MATWNLGACFACTSCLTRSAWRRCPACTRETIDLRGGAALLEARWSAWPAYAAGRALYSPRAIRSFRILKWIAAIATFATALAPVLGPWARQGHPPSGLELGIALGVGAVMSPLVFIFYSAYFLFIAHLFRGMSLALSAMAAVTPIGRARFEIVSRISRVLSRPLLPQLEVAGPGELVDAGGRGVLAQTLTLDFVRDGWSLMERFDVVATAPAQVKLDSGETTRVALEHGGVQYDQAASKRLDASSALPAWLQAPGRDGLRFRREFPAGTRVRFSRGREAHDDPRVLLVLG